MALLAGCLSQIGPAAAATVSCGEIVTANLTLEQDLGPCPATALRIAADDVVLDLGGHRVFGTPAPGESDGILLVNIRRATVRNGTVSGFDAGVGITGGADNRVTGLQVIDNIGQGIGPSGDGIRLAATSRNFIAGNVVRHNGPYAGIRLASSHGNVVQANVVQGNDVVNPVDPHGSPAGSSEDSGIRLTGGSSSNEISGNTVEGSGFDGIRAEFFSSRNVVRANVVRGNGYHPPEEFTPPGMGIRIDIAATFNLVEANQVFGNAGTGILVRGGDNRILFNRALGNASVFFECCGSRPLIRADLEDTTSPTCHRNLWKGNVYGTASPACAGAP